MDFKDDVSEELDDIYKITTGRILCGPRLYFLNLVAKDGDVTSKVPVGSKTEHNFIDIKERIEGENEIYLEYEST